MVTSPVLRNAIRRSRALLFMALLFSVVTLGARQAAAPAIAGLKALTIADYARWRAIQTPAISSDGLWVAWVYTQVRRDDELHVRHVDSAREHVVARASRPVFSDDGRWIAYSVAPQLKEIEKLEKDKKPVPRRAELMNLETGTRTGWENAPTFEFAKGSRFLAVKQAAPDPKPKHEGTGLILRDLSTGLDQLVGSVHESGFNKPGTFLALSIDAADREGNGLQSIDLGAGSLRVLDSAKARYTRLTWSEDGTALAVLRGNDSDTLEQRENTLITFNGFTSGSSPARVELEPGGAGLPQMHVISDKGALMWSARGDRVFFGIKPQRTKEKPTEGDDWVKASDVDIFHWNDERIQTVQRAQATADRNRTDRVAFDPAAGKAVRLTDGTIRSIQITRDGRWGIATDDRPYISRTDADEPRADYFRVDTATGERVRILTAQGRTLGLSPDSHHWLYWKDAHVWAYDLAANRQTNLTARAPVSFVNVEFDQFGEKPAYGVTGWTKDGRAVILTHQYDLWLVPLDGSTPRALTNGLGAQREMRLRYLDLDPEDLFIDLSKPMLLSAYGQWTKQSGYYELANGQLRELAYDDMSFGRLDKAGKAERYLFTRESWRDFPDLRVAGAGLRDPKKVTDANPQQSEYVWGRRLLFDFKNKDGVRLQGTLAIPDGYVAGERRPMLVNFYEKNSQNLHRHQAPRFASSPQFAGYVSHGYLVMQPDIHFRIGTSHSDMLECVEAAVRKVVEMGYADPARVGLHGHSYSGGGSAYIATRSTMFAAVVAGAAPIDLVSEFNTLFRGSGQNNHSYDIRGQGRYGTNPYDNFDLYWAQSPISGVRTMNTPLLYMHGDNDQTVEYLQGMEFYNGLRFNKKPVIFLSYPGEGHGLTKLENQVDYLMRMEQFYERYLRGGPALAWMIDGEAFTGKDQRKPIRITVEPATKPVPAGGGR